MWIREIRSDAAAFYRRSLTACQVHEKIGSREGSANGEAGKAVERSIGFAKRCLMAKVTSKSKVSTSQYDLSAAQLLWASSGKMAPAKQQR